MNRERHSPKQETQPKRAYNNAFREQQAEQTRERVLEAVSEQLGDAELSAFSVSRVAERAGVSEATIYRHFKSRQALFDAFNDWSSVKTRAPRPPETVDELHEFVRQLFAHFDRQAPLIRAQISAPGAREFRVRQRLRRFEAMLEMTASITTHLPESRRRALIALVRLMHGSAAWHALTDEYGIGTDDAAWAVQWAQKLIFDALERGAGAQDTQADE